eukprot:jgi/Chlat1/9086/Chrsp96S08367
MAAAAAAGRVRMVVSVWVMMALLLGVAAGVRGVDGGSVEREYRRFLADLTDELNVTVVQLKLDSSFAAFTAPGKQALFVSNVAAACSVQTQQIDILSVRAGSVYVTFGVKPLTAVICYCIHRKRAREDSEEKDDLPVPPIAPSSSAPPPPPAPTRPSPALASSSMSTHGAPPPPRPPSRVPSNPSLAPPTPVSPALSTTGSISSPMSTKGGVLGVERGSLSLRFFRFEELESATGRFSPSACLGQGGSGTVYLAHLPMPTSPTGGATQVRLAAVKWLDADNGGDHSAGEFDAELSVLSRLRHENLVSLIGFCNEDPHRRLLVYEYATRGSLASCLHVGPKTTQHGSDTPPPTPLTWHERLRIAAGSARGLAYLHDAVPPVVHRDFKPSNVLLDSTLRPMLADFGLARQYAMTGHLTSHSDTYSFGVVLLELLTGREPVDMRRPAGEQILVRWWTTLSSNSSTTPSSIASAIDPNMLGPIPSVDEAAAVGAVASRCIAPEQESRPSMSHVAWLLEGIQSGAITHPTQVLAAPDRKHNNNNIATSPSLTRAATRDVRLRIIEEGPAAAADTPSNNMPTKKGGGVKSPAEIGAGGSRRQSHSRHGSRDYDFDFDDEGGSGSGDGHGDGVARSVAPTAAVHSRRGSRS